VNVSVAGGRRVEIKGVHHHRRLPFLVHTEALRQLNLLRVKAELERRGVTADALQDPPEGHPWDTSALVMDAGVALADTNFQPVRTAISRGDTVCAVLLPGFAELLSHGTQPGYTFGHEISGRVRVIACPVHAPFMTHSDVGRGGLISRHWKVLERALGAGSGDAIVLVWAPREDAATAAREVVIRAREALEGIPSETRQAHPDGTNGFERILPGPDRMYPDTDTPPLPIPDAMVAEVRAQLAEAPWDRQARYEELGLDERSAGVLSVAPWADLFDEVAPETGETARRLAGALEKRLPYHARQRNGAKLRTPKEVPDPTRLSPVVRALERCELRPEALVWALDDVLADPDRAVAEVLDKYRPRPDDEAELEVVISETSQAAQALKTASEDGPLR